METNKKPKLRRPHKEHAQEAREFGSEQYRRAFFKLFREIMGDKK